MLKTFWKELGLAAMLMATLLASCASVPKTASTITPLEPSKNAAAIDQLRSWMNNESLRARSLSASGDITVEQNGESNSASFSMASKRIGRLAAVSSFDTHLPTQIVAERVDSLSIEINGPFGIKVARFMASPQKYEFYDILHDQTLSGRTDQESLEELTHLNGISLQDMSDIIYGLVRIDSGADDSVELYSDNANHLLLIVRVPGVTTSAYDFRGVAAADSMAGNLSLVRYRRWPGTAEPRNAPPVLTVQFMEPVMINGLSIPQHIEATAGQNKLILQYDHVEVNPASLVVRIKMP